MVGWPPHTMRLPRENQRLMVCNPKSNYPKLGQRLMRSKVNEVKVKVTHNCTIEPKVSWEWCSITTVAKLWNTCCDYAASLVVSVMVQHSAKSKSYGYVLMTLTLMNAVNFRLVLKLLMLSSSSSSLRLFRAQRWHVQFCFIWCQVSISMLSAMQPHGVSN